MKPMPFYFMLISILNLADCFFTYIALENKITTEANPLMAFVWDIHPLIFVLVKTFLSILLVFLALKFDTPQTRKTQWKWMLQLTSLAYLFVFFTHVTWIALYFRLNSFSF